MQVPPSAIASRIIISILDGYGPRATEAGTWELETPIPRTKYLSEDITLWGLEALHGCAILLFEAADYRACPLTQFVRMVSQRRNMSSRAIGYGIVLKFE